MAETVPTEKLADLFRAGTPLVDVRAPVEFAAGSLPGSICLPIMNDDERAQVGTTYKQQGQEAAIKLGHQLVSGAIKEARIEAWIAAVKEKPRSLVTCFRGGLRSRTAQAWLAERGVHRPRLEGGYKAARTFLLKSIDAFAAKHPLLVVSGPTGSAKTHFLRKISEFRAASDLEAHAHHRGSAFGAWTIPQPTQIDFENRLAVDLLRLEDKIDAFGPPVFEDESRMIGGIVVPESLFNRMREAPLIWLVEPLETRIENIFADYVTATDIPLGGEKARAVYARYEKSLEAISKKLGGVRYAEILADLRRARDEAVGGGGASAGGAKLDANRVWIRRLLTDYYDPLYFKSLDRREPKIWFKGSTAEALQRLRDDATARKGR